MMTTKATINNYGLCFLRGIGTPIDISKAKDIFNEGAEKGETESLYRLGFILEESDPDESRKNYEKAAKQGHVGAYIQFKGNQTVPFEFDKLIVNQDDSKRFNEINKHFKY